MVPIYIYKKKNKNVYEHKTISNVGKMLNINILLRKLGSQFHFAGIQRSDCLQLQQINIIDFFNYVLENTLWNNLIFNK